MWLILILEDTANKTTIIDDLGRKAKSLNKHKALLYNHYGITDWFLQDGDDAFEKLPVVAGDVGIARIRKYNVD